MRRQCSWIYGLAACALAACSDSASPSDAPPARPSFRAVVTTLNLSFLIEQTVFIPCANGGIGEFVTLSGRLHEKMHVTVNDAGHATVKTFDQPQGVSGIGETTGVRYHGAGVTQDTQTFQVDQEESFVNNFRVIGGGPGNNFSVHEMRHVTVHADGSVTVRDEQVRTSCT